MSLSSPFLLATSNEGKARELGLMLSHYALDAQIMTYKDHGLAPPDETGADFLENARIKAHAGWQATGLPTLADDSGLSVDALGGDPGIYTADWAEQPDGSRDFYKAMQRIDEALGTLPRAAQFECALVWVDREGREINATGIVRGHLLKADDGRGALGHGMDPWFVPDGFDITFGEMDIGQKNSLSHRVRAFAALVGQLIPQL